MRSSILLLAILFTSFVASAQAGNETEANGFYDKAEAAFGVGNYANAYENCQLAEKALGTTNSKILYVKIQALDYIARVDTKKAATLKKLIEQFYRVTDAKNYPPEKYQRILVIEQDMKNWAPSEDNDYKKLRGSTVATDYEAYFAKYPNSRYNAELRAKYNELQQQAKAPQQAAAITTPPSNAWVSTQAQSHGTTTRGSDNEELARKIKRASRAELATGVLILYSGLGMITLGALTLVDGEYSPYGLDPTVKGALYIAGGALTTAGGITLLTFGAKNKRKAKNLRNGVSFAPVISPATGTYAANFTLRF